MSASTFDPSRPLLAVVDRANAHDGAIVTYEEAPRSASHRARFEVIDAGAMIHVVEIPDGDGGALLDRAIAIPAGSGTGMDFVTSLIEALGGLDLLGVGALPFNALDQH